MDIDKIIELTNESFKVDDVLPYSIEKVKELKIDGYQFWFKNQNKKNNCIYITLIDKEGSCKVLLQELKKEDKKNGK